MENNDLVAGLIYQDTTKKPYEDLIPGFKEEGLAKRSIFNMPSKVWTQHNKIFSRKLMPFLYEIP
ncbi:hypothetical protein [Ammoniphilus sp. 3BR4]|uniref:hypothetical protein n=1 Tax=Ammoniphilus sp. 3BR4 TaxID=3158265 RepID=UPI003466065C